MGSCVRVCFFDLHLFLAWLGSTVLLLFHSFSVSLVNICLYCSVRPNVWCFLCCKFMLINAGSQYDRWGLVPRASNQSKKAQGTSWPHSVPGRCWSSSRHCGCLCLLSGLLSCNLIFCCKQIKLCEWCMSLVFKLLRLIGDWEPSEYLYFILLTSENARMSNERSIFFSFLFSLTSA